jgi:deoxyribose-phosphate aldolase
MDRSELVKRLQCTNVEPDATREDIRRHCETAAVYHFNAVMLQPCRPVKSMPEFGLLIEPERILAITLAEEAGGRM